MLRVVPDEDFLHTKINNKDVYVGYGATEYIPEDACSFRRQYYGWRFDSIKPKQVAKVSKLSIRNYQPFLQLSQQVSFDLLIFFLLGIGRNVRLDFRFPSNFIAS